MVQIDDDADEARDESPDEAVAEKSLEPVPRTRSKLSGNDLENRFDNWRDMRREVKERRTPEDDARRVRAVVSIGLGLALLAVLSASPLLQTGYQSQHAEYQTQIEQLQEDLAEAEDAPPEGALGELLAELTQSAAKDANTVRDGQQHFAELYHQANSDVGPGNGTPGETESRIAEHRQSLGPLFDERSLIVDDEEVQSQQSVLPFDPTTEIDPRYPWYVRYDDWQASSPESYSWGVESVMPDLAVLENTGRADTATVVWACRDAETGEVLAWASARYVKTEGAADGVFSQLAVTVTNHGWEQQAPGAADEGVSVPGLDGTDAEEGEG